MSGQEAPIKIVTVSGNFKEDYIEYTPYPSNEFTKGRWNVAVSQIFVDSTTSSLTTDQVIGISSNFVKNYEYNQSSEVVDVFTPLKSLLLKKKSFYQKDFDITWILTNNTSESFRIFPLDLKTYKPLKIDCKVFLTILFQRIK